MSVWFAFLFAGFNLSKQQFLVLVLGISAFYVGLGVYNLCTKRVIVSPQKRFINRLLGKEDYSPEDAVLIGVGYCFVGAIFLFVSIWALGCYPVDTPRSKLLPHQSAPTGN